MYKFSTKSIAFISSNSHSSRHREAFVLDSYVKLPGAADQHVELIKRSLLQKNLSRGDTMGFFSRLFQKNTSKKKIEIFLGASKEKTMVQEQASKKKNEIALGAAFISCINESIKSVQSGSHKTYEGSLNKNVRVRTKGCSLSSNEMDIMDTAAKIALNRALDIVSKKDASQKTQIISELWPSTNNIEVSFSLTPDQKFVWSLDLD